MRTAIICLSIITALVAAKLPEEEGSLRGIIFDKDTEEALIGANITLEQEGVIKMGVISDVDGNFAFSSVPAGNYDLKVMYIGYETYNERLVIKNGKEHKVEIHLSPSSAELEAVMITESRKVRPKAIEAVAVDSPSESYFAPSKEVLGVSEDATVISADRMSVASDISYGFTTSDVSVSGADGMVIESKSKSAVSGEYLELREAEIERMSAEKKEMETMRKAEEEAKLLKLPREPINTAGLLTAGNWTDNQNWKFFEGLMKKKEWQKMQEHWGFNMLERVPVKVSNGKNAIIDAVVKLKDASGNVLWETRTDVHGEAFLFTNMFEDKQKADYVEVVVAGSTVKKELKREGALVEIEIPTITKASRNLDIMFMIDATGSMGDELSYIQSELTDVIKRVKIANEQVASIAVSCNVYRDQGDEYVVRSFPFRQNVSMSLQDLNDQRAGGGGDYEEAVEQAYADAVNNHKWSEEATARLMFFVLDAPPHHNFENLKKLQEVTKDAAKKGVKVIPIASSGVDKNTEFLMRFLGISTGGTYIFLTDDSGIGNSHIEPTIGKYEVKLLNNLLVEVINSYLNEGELLSKK